MAPTARCKLHRTCGIYQLLPEETRLSMCGEGGELNPEYVPHLPGEGLNAFSEYLTPDSSGVCDIFAAMLALETHREYMIPPAAIPKVTG